jgi:citrate lyase subunit beta/citryl-CoA lyase
LYVPGDQPNKLAKATERGADAVIADLEDAVGPDRKEDGVETVAAWLADADPLTRTELWVRLGLERAREDLPRLVVPALDGLVLPKAEHPDELDELDRMLTTTEHVQAHRERGVHVAPLIESARGMLQALALTQAPRVRHLGMGEADLVADLGLEPSVDEHELAHARSTVVSASAAGELPGPTAATSTDFRDTDGLRASTERLRRFGFRARSAIHPAQVPVIAEVFTPHEADVAHARAVVDAYEGSEEGVATGPDGRMIDRAVARAARDILSRAR